MRAWIGAALLLGLAACGAVPRVETQAPADAVVMASRFGDADPVDWPGHPPSSYPVHGVDLSKFQPPVDWAQARASGVSFAFLKATEGGDRVDDLFDLHRRGAAQAGVPWAAYHFFYFCRPAIEQAQWFIRNVPRVRGMLPPVLDMEWNPFSPTCATYRPPPEVVRAEMDVFMDALESHYGQRPVIYTDPAFFQQNGFSALRGEEFWLRSTSAHPTDRYGEPWTFWQYSATGLVPGIQGEVDLNAFGGGLADWRAWIARRAVR